MQNLFKSYLMGGFECSTHRIQNGRRLDLINSTKHDRFAEKDYERLRQIGMHTARDGVRWHLIEKEPFKYDFSSLKQQVGAIKKTGIQIIWDYFHYGYPDDLDIFSPAFVERFAVFSRALTEFFKSELRETLFVCPVNEISFFSWAAGEVGIFYPYATRRGDELKKQLVRTTIASINAICAAAPDTRFVQTDPAIHVIAPKKANYRQRRAAENYRLAQFEAFDMLTGQVEPDLGGDEKYLDIIGLNYYFHNQWRFPSRRKIPLGHPEYRPLHKILEEYHERYNRPLLLAETGIEDEKRPEWFRYVSEELKRARLLQIPVEGICLYPVVNHPGWVDNRHCHNGLWDYADERGNREIYQPLAEEIRRQCLYSVPVRFP